MMYRKIRHISMSDLPNTDDPKINSQVTAVTMKLAELQSQVLRLNALGDRLAEEASIPDK